MKKYRIVERDLLFKQTNSVHYLLFFSCHLKHIENNISFSVERRMYIIVLNSESCIKTLKGLKQRDNIY